MAQGKKKVFHIAVLRPIAILSGSTSPYFRNSFLNTPYLLNTRVAARSYLASFLAALPGVLICVGTLTAALPYDVHAESAIAQANAIHTFNILPNPLEDALNRFA